VSSKTGQLQ
jgi:DivIVA domain-containing protein